MKSFKFLILLIFTFYGCEEKIKPSVIQTVDSRTLPQQESWNSKIIISDSNHISAIIYAGYTRVYEERQKTEMSNGVKVHFYNTKGELTSILTSEEGSVDEVTNNLEARKNVLVISSDSSRMKTQHLYWDNQRQLIHTPDFVEITTKTDKLWGYGFESDQFLKNYRIFHVSGQTKAE